MSRFNIFGINRAKNKRRIQAFLDEAGVDQIVLAARTGLSHQAVSATLNGKIHSQTVLEELRKAGVPEELICDPRHVEETQAV